MTRIFIILLVLSACASKNRETVVAIPDEPNQASTVEDVASILREYDSPTRDYWQNPELVIEKLGSLQGKVIADVGVGTGYFTFRMAPEAAKIIALDVENKFLEYIEDRKFELGDNRITSKIETRLCQPDDPLLNRDEVDMALIVNTYHFIEDRPSYLAKVNEGLRSEGEVVLVDFKEGSMPIGPSEPAKVSVLKAQEELRNAGFNIIEVDTSGLQFQYIIKARK